MHRIYHLTLPEDWREAVESGRPYVRSTRNASLAQQGFIHCSMEHQVAAVAEAIYGDRPDVLLVTIDPASLDCEVRLENLEGGDELFPHVYGPLPLDAVTDVRRLASDEPLDVADDEH